MTSCCCLTSSVHGLQGQICYLMEEVWIFFLSLLSPNRGRPLVSGVSLPHAGFLLTLLQSPESVSTFTQVSGSHEICGFALLARLTGPDSDVDQDCQTLLLLLLYNLYILYNFLFSKFKNRAGFNTLAGRSWPACHMFDTPDVNYDEKKETLWTKVN